MPLFCSVEIEEYFLLVAEGFLVGSHRFRHVQARLSKGMRKKTKAAQQRQLLDVVMVACGLRHACLPDHGVTLEREAWQEVLESLRADGHVLAMGLDVLQLEGTPLIVHRERLRSSFAAEAKNRENSRF